MHTVNQWKTYTIEQVKDFCKKHNITTKISLKKNYLGLYVHCRKNGFLDSLELHPLRRSTEEYKNAELVQTFINENTIKSRVELKNCFCGLYWKAVNNHWMKSLCFEEDKLSWTNINNLDDAQEFVNKNEIQTARECSSKYPGFESRCCKLGIFGKISFPKRLIKSWRHITTLEQAQSFVNELGLTRSEMSNTFPGFVDLAYNKKWMSDLVFNKSKKNSWENRIYNALKQVAIFQMHVKASYSNYSELDFFSEKYKIAVEVQGPTHFYGLFGKDSFTFSRKSDIKKNRWCKENGIRLFYFTYDKSLVNTYGYPYYVYTSENKLLKDISDEIKKIEIKNN